MRNPNVCKCEAYPFPHRPFSGKGCFAEELFDYVWQEAICGDCRHLSCYYEQHGLPGIGEQICECTLMEVEGPENWYDMCPVLSDLKRRWEKEHEHNSTSPSD